MYSFFFLVAALIQLLLHREHRRDKRYGPSPANNYTSGAGRRAGLFRRKNRDGTALTGTRDAEVGTVGTATTAVEPTTTSTTYKPANPYGYDNTRTNATNY